MVQLVGFLEETALGIAEAERRIGRLVLAPTWKGLSDVDRRFLIAMARPSPGRWLARDSRRRQHHYDDKPAA